MTSATLTAPPKIDASHVHETLRHFQLTDGYPMVFDLEGSHGSWLRDAHSGKEYLDGFTGFASWPMGYNHPMMNDPDFTREMARVALVKPANSDLYTTHMASFVEAFGSRVTPPEYEHHFWISGGALAVENAMKTAFDWKARKLGRTSMTDSVDDLVILHFAHAFHGRTGYTLSVTNTLPDKVGLFPKLDWPRAHSPVIEFDAEGCIANDVEAEEARACREIEAAFARDGQKVAGILIEPMQGEGGDNHFRGEFLAKLRQYADENEALLLYDEVQTGFFSSGKPWMWQHFDGAEPDVVAFGKKSQVCGIYAGPRIDEVDDNVFQRSSRINSTWGGNLTDMVRCRRFIEIIEAENLAQNIRARGEQLVAGLREIARSTGAFNNVRGRGTLAAFSLETTEQRNALNTRLFERELLLLPSGNHSIRFRLPFVITSEEIGKMLDRVRDAVTTST